MASVPLTHRRLGRSTRCAVLAYDYTVLAGTQGHMNHKKKDRLFELAAEWEIPTVFYTEGGGGRPGDVDGDDLIMAWSDLKTFTTWAELAASRRELRLTLVVVLQVTPCCSVARISLSQRKALTSA